MERYRGAGTVMIVLLFVVALVAMAEVGAGLAVMTSEASRVPTWQVFVQTGDEARARGDAPAARRAYLSALFRARGERSLIGILLAAEGFKTLGDREVVEHALRMAVTLGPSQDPDATRARLQTLRDRLDATDALPFAARAPR